MRYSKSDLEHAFEVLKSSSAHSRIKDATTLGVCRMSRKALKTVRVTTVRGYVHEAIDKYSTIEKNYEKNQIRILKEKKRVSEVKKKAICLYNLEVKKP